MTEPELTEPDWVPAGIDTSRPSLARIYDYYLGGTHNFPADRELARSAEVAWPLVADGVRAGREFLVRAVHHLAADLGVRQFLDLGSGIPTQRNVHDVVQAVDPAARVVYVDIDPVAVAHGEALLAGNPHATAVQADLRRPELILSLPAVTALLDPAEPTAVLMMLVLHFVGDDDEPAKLVRRYREALGAGSWLALSHAGHELRPDGEGNGVKNGVAELYSRTPTPITMRTHEEVSALLDGYQLLPPGLVPLGRWRPGRIAEAGPPEHVSGWAGVAQAS